MPSCKSVLLHAFSIFDYYSWFNLSIFDMYSKCVKNFIANDCVSNFRSLFLLRILFVWLPAYKLYKSAYDKDSNPSGNREYFCEVCQKQLNGPQPYSAHMNSRAHRDEVEAAALYA